MWFAKTGQREVICRKATDHHVEVTNMATLDSQDEEGINQCLFQIDFVLERNMTVTAYFKSDSEEKYLAM